MGRLRFGLWVVMFFVTTAAYAATSTDTDFSGIVTRLSDWLNGTMGGVFKLGAMLVGVAIGVKTGKLYVPLGFAIAVYFAPGVVDGIFGAVV